MIDPLALNADLHCHSKVSDGTLTPQGVAARAHANGVQLWSLTDHDEIGGLHHARRAALELGMPFLSGVEISVTFAAKTVHIVGLGFDIDDTALRDGLAATRGGRSERAREMGQSLEAAGIAGAYEGALKYASNPDLVSRTHFARFLVESGVCANTPEVFRHYLAEGKPGFVPHRWATLSDAVRWIRGAGGMAVIAHPGRYNFSPVEEFAFFTEFKQLGGEAVEVVTGSHRPDEYPKYANLAREFGFYASRGSDFHSPDESHTDLGTLAPLPGGLIPVWELLAERVHTP